MRVETKTSVYELTVSKVYRLEKLSLKPGRSSHVSAGRVFESSEVYLDDFGGLNMPLGGDRELTTSTVQNLEGVKEWLEQNK